MYILESAEEMKLPAEAIAAVQTSLQLMGNANLHNSATRRNVVLTQLNPQLKQLLGDNDYKDAPPMLFGENFGSLARERIEAAAALTKILALQTGIGRVFTRATLKNIEAAGVADTTAAVTTDRRAGNHWETRTIPSTSSQRNDYV